MLERLKGPLYFITLSMAVSTLWATAHMRALSSEVEKSWFPAIKVPGFNAMLQENCPSPYEEENALISFDQTVR